MWIYKIRRSFDGWWNNVEEPDTILSRLHCSKGQRQFSQQWWECIIPKKRTKIYSNHQQLSWGLLNSLSNSSSTHKSKRWRGFGAAGTYTQGNTNALFALEQLFSDPEWNSLYNVCLLWSCANLCQILLISWEITGEALWYFKRTHCERLRMGFS